jgi:hypothetical protein
LSLLVSKVGLAAIMTAFLSFVNDQRAVHVLVSATAEDVARESDVNREEWRRLLPRRLL